MREIATVDPTKLVAIDEQDPNAGNANHCYQIQSESGAVRCSMQFQHGPRNVPKSIPGIFDDTLLAIVEDRYLGFQSGEFACPENDRVLEALGAGRAAIAERVEKRRAQGVLGKNETHES